MSIHPNYPSLLVILPNYITYPYTADVKKFLLVGQHVHSSLSSIAPGPDTTDVYKFLQVSQHVLPSLSSIALEVPVVLWLSSLEMDTATRVQILDLTDCISHSTNTLGEGMNPIILPPAMGK